MPINTNYAIIICITMAALACTSCKSRQSVIRDDVYTTSSSPSSGTVDKPGTNTLQGYGLSAGPDDNQLLMSEVSAWLGVPYKYAGTDHNGVDCSGLVCALYDKVYCCRLQRNSARMYEQNCQSIPLSDVREGDLLFFSSRKSAKAINHVGLYLKDGLFVHAGSKGVTIDSMSAKYYHEHYVASGRVSGR